MQIGTISCTICSMVSEKRGLVRQLLEFVHDLACNMQGGGQTDVVIMDFSKAFDKVGHRRLIKKLGYYGVRD